MSAPAASRSQAPRSIWRARWRRFLRHKPGLTAAIFLLVIFTLCIFADLVAALRGVDPDTVDLLSRFKPPSTQYWLGTDEIGRDVLTRLLYGGRVSLAVGVMATLLGGLLGASIGVASGYLQGSIDALLMRFTDCVIALPLIPFLIVLGAIDLTKVGLPESWATSQSASLWRIVVVISLVDWTAIARISRAATRASGAGAFYNICAHVLPNIATPLIVAGALTVGRVILFESTLSFLGFGVTPPTPTWGNMLTNAQELVTSAPALAIYPGLLIFLTVISVNFVGDGLRVAFDPRSDS